MKSRDQVIWVSELGLTVQGAGARGGGDIEGRQTKGERDWWRGEEGGRTK